MGAGALSASELEELVERARAGDEGAWAALVRGTSNAVYRGLAAFDVPHDVRQDLYHETYIRLLEHIDDIEQPAALPKWLMTTARRLALGHVRSRRLVPLDEVPEAVSPDDVHERLLDAELSVAVRRAFDRLPDTCRAVLRLLTVVPPLSYAEIAELLGWPLGNVGPTRLRCLDKLRRTPELAPYADQFPR